MKKWFGIAHKPLHIEDDFKPFDLGGNWKRTIDQRYNKGNRKLVEDGSKQPVNMLNASLMLLVCKVYRHYIYLIRLLELKY